MANAPSKRGRVVEPRVCCQCGAVWTAPDSRWDVHLRGDTMLDTCSPECRAARSLPERQQGLVIR